MPGERTRGNEHKLKHRQFNLNIIIKYCKVVQHWTRLEIHKTWLDKQPSCSWPSFEQELELNNLQSSLQPQPVSSFLHSTFVGALIPVFLSWYLMLHHFKKNCICWWKKCGGFWVFFIIKVEPLTARLSGRVFFPSHTAMRIDKL